MNNCGGLITNNKAPATKSYLYVELLPRLLTYWPFRTILICGNHLNEVVSTIHPELSIKEYILYLINNLNETVHLIEVDFPHQDTSYLAPKDGVKNVILINTEFCHFDVSDSDKELCLSFLNLFPQLDCSLIDGIIGYLKYLPQEMISGSCQYLATDKLSDFVDHGYDVKELSKQFTYVLSNVTNRQIEP